MSRGHYSTFDSNALGYAVRRTESNFYYWAQLGQALPVSQGEFFPLSVYGLSSNHLAHPPSYRRPLPSSSIPAPHLPLSSPRLSNSSSRTLSTGTLHQETNDDSAEPPSPYVSFQDQTLPIVSTTSAAYSNNQSGFRNAPCFEQSSVEACACREFLNATGPVLSGRCPRHNLARGSHSSPASTPVEYSANRQEQHVPLSVLAFSQVPAQSGIEVNTGRAPVEYDQGNFQFENIFAPTCNNETRECHSGEAPPLEIAGKPEHNSAKRRNAVGSTETSKRRATSRRQGETGSRPRLKSPSARTVLQGGSQDDCFNVHIWHQVEGRPPRTTRSNFGPERRLEVAQVREKGACFECRFSKQRCDENRPCKRCQGLMRKAGEGDIFRSQPCFQLDLAQCTFFRRESAMWDNPLRQEFSWISPRDISLDVGFGGKWNEPSPSLKIECRHFNPQPDDIVNRKWGVRMDQVVTVPPYCAPDIHSIQSRIQQVISMYSDFILGKADRLGPAASDLSDFVYRTLKIATSQSARDPVLNDTLCIFFGSRFSAQPRTLKGNNTLSIKPIVEEDAHDQGYIPIPPMLDYQLDTSTILWMTDIMGKMLTQLWKTLLSKSKKDWLNIYLIISLLVSNLEMIQRMQLEFIAEHGHGDSSYFGSRLSQRSRPMIEMWELTARHLIHVWNVYKRGVFKNAPLFSRAYYSKGVAAGSLDDEAQQYYQYVIETRSGLDLQMTPKEWIHELILDEKV